MLIEIINYIFRPRNYCGNKQITITFFLQSTQIFNSTQNCSYQFRTPQKHYTSTHNPLDTVDGSPHNNQDDANNEVIIELMTNLEVTKKHCVDQDNKVSELEEQLVTLSEYYRRRVEIG